MSSISFNLFSVIRKHRVVKALASLCVGYAFLPQVHAASNQQWVSDDLSAYVRSGPTNGYRIVGALNAGTQVQVISSQNDYTQVRTPNGDSVWIPSNQLQNQEGAVARANDLQQKVNDLEAQLHSGTNTIQQRADALQERSDGQQKYIHELESTRSSLNQQLNDSQSQVRRLQGQLGDEHQQELMRYLAYGGSIAGIGLIVGLILPSMTPRRKKRKDRFF